jgi:RNA polymerase sigma-70 factor (ECF subfamily)
LSSNEALVSDAAAFEAFVLEFQDLVYGTALRLLSNPAEAEDVAQTVFMKAFERFDDVVGNPSAPGWLKTVTTNQCLNHINRYRNRWRLFSEMEAGPTGPSGPAGPAGPGEHVEVLEVALRKLPAHQRVPIVLFYFDELSYQQIADRLSVSLSKVKSDIHRGRQALREALERAGHGRGTHVDA